MSGEKDKKHESNFIKAEIAMQCAAQKAREKARCTRAGVVVVKDGNTFEERQEA